MAVNTLDYYWDPVTWLFPPSPPYSSSSGGGFRATDRSDSDLSGVNRSNLVASAGQTEERYGSNLRPIRNRLPQVFQEEYGGGGAPQLGSIYALHISGKVV